MATWRDIKAFVRSRYRVVQEQSEMVQLLFDTDNGRSQYVYLWHRQLARDQDWLIIGSRFGEVDQVDLPSVLEAAGRLVVGGIVIMGDFVAIRHSVPLTNLDTNELEGPLELVSYAADQMEDWVHDEDQY